MITKNIKYCKLVTLNFLSFMLDVELCDKEAVLDKVKLGEYGVNYSPDQNTDYSKEEEKSVELLLSHDYITKDAFEYLDSLQNNSRYTFYAIEFFSKNDRVIPIPEDISMYQMQNAIEIGDFYSIIALLQKGFKFADYDISQFNLDAGSMLLYETCNYPHEVQFKTNDWNKKIQSQISTCLELLFYAGAFTDLSIEKILEYIKYAINEYNYAGMDFIFNHCDLWYKLKGLPLTEKITNIYNLLCTHDCLDCSGGSSHMEDNHWPDLVSDLCTLFGITSIA